MSGPKVLFWDIETAPLLSYTWGLFDQNIGLNMVAKDWHLLSWAAKWQGQDKVHYLDQRHSKNIENDKFILQGLWNLLNEADIVVTQNGKKFDSKKTNARFILNGMKPPKPYKHIDTLQLAKKHFAFTSNKLEYMSEKLCTKYKKLKHKKFGGFELWKECLANNPLAWKEMEKYNKHDVLALEELYDKLAPWGTGIDFNAYHGATHISCNCGSTSFTKEGFNYTKKGKFQQLKCKECGTWRTDSNNLLSEVKRESLKGIK